MDTAPQKTHAMHACTVAGQAGLCTFKGPCRIRCAVHASQHVVVGVPLRYQYAPVMLLASAADKLVAADPGGGVVAVVIPTAASDALCFALSAVCASVYALCTLVISAVATVSCCFISLHSSSSGLPAHVVLYLHSCTGRRIHVRVVCAQISC